MCLRLVVFYWHPAVWGAVFSVWGVGLLLIFVPGGCGLTLLRATLHPLPLGAPLSN